MKRYETYKDSGIQWVGEIPSHWDVVKTSYLFDDIGSGTTPNTNDDSLYDTDNGINWLQTGDLNDGHITKTSKKISQKAIEGNGTLRLYPINSLVIALYGATIGKVGVLDIESTTNQACCVLPPSDKISTDFAYYIFLASKEALLNLASGGGQPNISQAIIKNHRIPYPSYAEQQSIVSFLDHKVGQIDATIAEKEQMLEDLKNYRSAIISEAVTKGLDKNVEMKDSGIEWCGYIPIHWQVLKIGYIFQNLDYLRQPISSENRERNNPQYEYYGASGVIDKIDSYNVNDKVLLIGEDGANLVSRTLPLIYKAEGKFWVNNHAHILKPISSDYDYMAFLLETADYTNYITGSAQPKLSQEKLSSVKLPVPPIEEQKQIAKKLICIVPLIDRSLIEIEKIIKDLKSYKSALITEAVTGKIDLRDWKPKEEKV